MGIDYLIWFFLSIALILHILVGVYAYKVMKIADYLILWKRGWFYFLISVVVTTLRRGIELGDMGSTGIGTIHTALAFISSVALILFIYNISKVFVNVSKLHDESIFTTVLKEIPVGILIHDLDSSIVYSNPMATKILNISKSALSGLFTSEKWHFLREDGTSLPIDEYPVNKIIKSGKAFSNMIIGINHYKDTLWVLCNAYFINAKHQVVTVFADVSSLKEVEKELELSEEKYKKAFMSSHDGIIITRMSDGMINSVNKTFTLLTGYSEEDVEGKTTIELNIWKNIEDRNKVITDLQNGLEVKDFDTYFIGKDGKDIHGLSSYSTLILNGEVHVLTSVKLICERSRNGRKEDKI